MVSATIALLIHETWSPLKLWRIMIEKSLSGINLHNTKGTKYRKVFHRFIQVTSDSYITKHTNSIGFFKTTKTKLSRVIQVFLNVLIKNSYLLLLIPFFLLQFAQSNMILWLFCTLDLRFWSFLVLPSWKRKMMSCGLSCSGNIVFYCYLFAIKTEYDECMFFYLFQFPLGH